MTSTPSWKREKRAFAHKLSNRVRLVTFHPQRWTVRRAYMRYIPALALFFAPTWWNTTRWSASQRCKRWRKYLTTIDIVIPRKHFLQKLQHCSAQQRRFEESRVYPTRYRFELKFTHCVLFIKVSIKRVVVMYYLKCVWLSLIFIVPGRKYSKRRHLWKTDAANP